MDATLRTMDGRAVLRLERRLAHPPARVWRALTEPAELSRWFPATVSLELFVGAEVRFDFGDAAPGGRITVLDPPRVFEFTWGDDLLRWELRPEGGGCVLVFTHTFDDRAGAASFASGWRGCLDALELVLDGRPVELTRPPADLHDAYVDAFDLDAGVWEADGEGWRVRFERQLTRPASEVWDGLAASPPRVGDPPPTLFTTAAAPPGAVSARQRPGLLEYAWRHDGRVAGRVRWELSDERGTGHGARLILTQTGPHDLEGVRDTALVAWREHLRDLARRLRER